MLQDREGAEPVDVRPDDHLTYVMAKAAHLLERRIEDDVRRRTTLTMRQFSALAHIARRPGCSSSDLARALLTTPQSVNTLIARMVAAGLVDRAPSRPRRPLVLTLTDAGLTALRRAEVVATDAEAAVLAELPAEDLDITLRTLRHLLGHLTAAPGGPGTGA